jgi:hypothetical protein
LQFAIGGGGSKVDLEIEVGGDVEQGEGTKQRPRRNQPTGLDPPDQLSDNGQPMVRILSR